ncbi:hypothetical protein BH11PSE4_BH11PSE4_19790 [soil metagenome]
MPYALYSHAEQVSAAFASKAEVWAHAAASGLVIELGSSEEDPPRRVLHVEYFIQECALDSGRRHEGAIKTSTMPIAGSTVSPQSAAAAL